VLKNVHHWHSLRVDGTSLLACDFNDDDERPSLARAFGDVEQLPLLPASARNDFHCKQNLTL
jgi:hypothetical protein